MLRLATLRDHSDLLIPIEFMDIDELTKSPRTRGAAFLKRLFDVIVSFTALVVLAPVLGLLAILVRLGSNGPALYRALRAGVGGAPFTMYKFRSMVIDADRNGPLITAGDDPRVTRLGAFLRKAKLDELPSLWNVLTGDMSIVGPRPENLKSVALYTAEQKTVLDLRPGLFSLATIKYRNEEAILAGAANLERKYYEIMQDKLKLELEYSVRRSFSLDMMILWCAIVAILRGTRENA